MSLDEKHQGTFFLICLQLFYGKIRPLRFIQNYHIIGLAHAQLFIETIGIFILSTLSQKEKSVSCMS
jgi:aromatic ring-opening dioxygenase LigB subunit